MYFDRPTQATLVARLERMLAPDGLLVLGHAENLLGLDAPCSGHQHDLPRGTRRRVTPVGEASCTPS
jgi:chemotaxis methyl-accepting protein methylase